MKDDRIIDLKFEGIDDFHRAVFKDVNSRNRYGDCSCTKTGKPEDVIAFYRTNLDLLEYFGTSFGCEPNGGTCAAWRFNIIG